MSRCPSDLELERLLRVPGGAEAHLAVCPRCAARAAEARRLGEEFEREILPATIDAVVAGSARVGLRGRLRARPWLAPAAAVAAAALVLVLRAGLLAGGEAGQLVLLAYRLGPEGGAVADGQVVPAAAGLRFEVRPGRSCNLFIAAADAAGRVARIYPSDGSEGRSVQAGATLAVPDRARPDGAAGPQRFFAVCGCGDEPVTWDGIERAARGVGGSAAGVRAARALPGLPDDALQATLLIERRP